MSVQGSPLTGRVALVTGAGRGLGRAHALELGRLGATVVVNDIGAAVDGQGRDQTAARAVVEEIESVGGSALADDTDVASIAGGAAAVHVALEAFGAIHIIVNNAGFSLGGGDIERPDDDELDTMFAIHLKAALGTMGAGIASMRVAGFGRIINTVSEVALDVRMAGSGLAYGAAKAALWSATLSASRRLAPDGITVNAISPGARTRMSAVVLDAGFRDGASAHLDLDPAHVARVVAFLCLEEASDITGRVIHVAGAHRREYETRRSSQTELVRRVDAALDAGETVQPE